MSRPRAVPAPSRRAISAGTRASTQQFRIAHGAQRGLPGDDPPLEEGFDGGVLRDHALGAAGVEYVVALRQLALPDELAHRRGGEQDLDAEGEALLVRPRQQLLADDRLERVAELVADGV